MSSTLAATPPGRVRTGSGTGSRPIRVFMMDLLSIVPYYTGHLCASLERIEGLSVTLGSITYHHDREFFRRQNLRNRPGALDVAFRFGVAPATLRRALKILESLINMAALSVRFSISKPDVLHVQFTPLMTYGLPFELWFLKLVRMLGIRVVYTVHNVLPHDSGEGQRGRYRRIYQLADRLICHDAQARDRLATEFDVAPDRISIIPHGPLFEDVSRATMEQARTNLGLRSGECVVLWQGILRPYKGVSFLLQAWRQICGAGVRARLAIVGGGDGEIAEAIRTEVASLGISSSVRLDLRFVSVEELADWHQAADILVYPYSEITTSGALMTGIGYGKAVVASALPAFERILRSGENALLVRYGDVDALAGSLIRLISDEGLRQRLGERLRESQADTPRWPGIAKQTRECYEAVLPALRSGQ